MSCQALIEEAWKERLVFDGNGRVRAWSCSLTRTRAMQVRVAVRDGFVAALSTWLMDGQGFISAMKLYVFLDVRQRMVKDELQKKD